jgi:hypothetical protein
MAPSIVQADLWSPTDSPSIIIITANGAIRKSGTLVMGRGAALQATQRYPGIDDECAQAIMANPESTRTHKGWWVYGFLVVRQLAHLQPGFGIFQVKYAWMEKADLGLIAFSVAKLNEYAQLNPGMNIRMNYPGIGNGGLARDSVEELLDCLPGNVTVCYQ